MKLYVAYSILIAAVLGLIAVAFYIPVAGLFLSLIIFLLSLVWAVITVAEEKL